MFEREGQHTRDADLLECAFVTSRGESDRFAVLEGLPEEMVRENAKILFDGQWFLEYDPAWLQPGLPPTLVVGSSVRTIEPHEVRRKLGHVRRVLDLYGPSEDSPARGVAIVVRVSTADRVPNTSAAEIEQAIFGETGSFASQLAACSFGREEIRPYNASEPVLEVSVEQNVTDLTFNGLFLAANPLVKRHYGVGRLDEVAQFAMFVGPQGLGSGNLPELVAARMIAYGGIRHFKSVYADEVVLTPQVLLHETGHNRNLGHTWEANKEYEDDSSVMGSLWRGTVHQCYNGLDYSYLGWMEDRTVDVDVVTGGPQVHMLAFFGDYPLAEEEEPTLLRANGLFLLYNRRKGINNETRDHEDQILIHKLRRDSTIEGTELMAALDEENREYESEVMDVRVRVCGRVDAEDASSPDTMIVGIGSYTDDLRRTCWRAGWGEGTLSQERASSRRP